MAKPIIERFMKFVSPEPNSGCWLWLGGLNIGGYGQFMTPPCTVAHRVSYELFVGPIPEGLDLDHLCRVRSCVNPKHLEPVTQLENYRRGLGGMNGALASGAKQKAKTHCPRGHEYSAENTYIHDGKRYCRACDRERPARPRRSRHRKALPKP